MRRSFASYCIPVDSLARVHILYLMGKVARVCIFFRNFAPENKSLSIWQQNRNAATRRQAFLACRSGFHGKNCWASRRWSGGLPEKRAFPRLRRASERSSEGSWRSGWPANMRKRLVRHSTWTARVRLRLPRRKRLRRRLRPRRKRPQRRRKSCCSTKLLSTHRWLTSPNPSCRRGTR